MSKQQEEEASRLLGDEEQNISEIDYNDLSILSRKERLRLHIGGLLFIGLGIYVIYRTVLAVSTLFTPISSAVRPLPPWNTTRYAFIFGDSYTTIDYDVNGPPPSESNPLGNPPYPGHTTTGGPNWVGYLATEFNESVLLAHDFAIGGHTVQGVEYQINERFLHHAANKPTWAPWTEDNSIFYTWIGINDCQGFMDAQSQLTSFFKLQDKLYKHGARNFVFLNVPPFDRSPAWHNDEGVRNLINEWNVLLNEFTLVFRQRYNNLVTAVVYDTHALFTEVLNEPEKWGFKDNLSKCHDWDCIWDDDLHPTFAMHKVIAKDLAAFLTLEG